MKLSQRLERLVGLRVKTLKELEEYLKDNFKAKNPSVSEHEDNDDVEIGGVDFRLECSLNTLADDDQYDDFELFFLKDREDNYYITEVNPWGVSD